MLFIRLYEILIIGFVLYHIIRMYRLKKSEKEGWRHLTVADWLFYFCATVSFCFSLSLYDMLYDFNLEELSLCIIFGITVVTTFLLMLWQNIWLIRYNNNILIFRNSFGIKKEFLTNEIVILSGERVTKILCNGKEITKYDIMYMNLKEVILFEKEINKIKNMPMSFQKK